MKRTFSFLALCLFAAQASAALLPIEPYSDWPVLQASTEPPRTDTLVLRAVWRLDCGEDVQPMVGKIVSAAPGLNGRVLLVDRQLCQVLVIGPGGEAEKTVGRPGEGPGELTGAYRALQLSDGRIGIANGSASPTMQIGVQGRIVLLDEVSDPAGFWLAGGDPGSVPLCILRELRHSGGHIVATTHRTQISPPISRFIRELSLIDTSDGARTVIARSVRECEFGNPVFHEKDTFEPFADGRVDVSSTGKLAIAPERDRWLLAIREIDGSGFMVERPWTPVKRTAVEKEKAFRDLGGYPGSKALDDHPVIGRVRWRPNGRIWVEPYAVDPAPSAVACFDELDARGTLLRRVQLEVPGAQKNDRLLLLEDGRFVLLRGFGRVEDSADFERLSAEVILLEL